MSKEYLSEKDMKPEKPKGFASNKNTILLSIVIVLLLAIITFIIVVSLKSKNGNENNPSGTPTVAESEREFSHGTKEFPQAGGEFPSGGNTSASSDAQSSATAAPNAQQSQIDSQGSSQPQAGQNTPQPTPAPNTNPGGTVDTNKALTKSEFIRFLNAQTAKAAKGSYKLTRTGAFTKAIDVGNATSALNTIIKGVDKDADLNSVVGGFLAINEPVKGTATSGKLEGADAKYALKGMTLTDADVISFNSNASGTQYTIQLANCNTPNANSAIAHATNDYITFAEVNKDISDSVGSAVVISKDSSYAEYTQIKFVVAVSNGKITQIKYSYSLDAKPTVKLVAITSKGTCAADIKGEYTDIRY